MTTLLAILVSLALTLTGATLPGTEPASRVLQVSNLTVRHNEEAVTLSPYASLGVMTDGAKTVFDFFIGNGDDVYLPFQVSADADGLLVLSDNSNVTLKVSAEEVDALLAEADLDEEGVAVLELMGDYMSAYGDLFKLMDDPEAMQAIQANADAIYDELVDRGEGVVGTAEYDEETYEVTTYEYDMDATQLGALADALYTSDERLAKFYEVYFRLLHALPEDSGLSDADSFEALMEKFGNIDMHVTESIGEDGLNISDIIMHVSTPELEQPLEFVIHTVQTDSEKTAEMASEIDLDGMTLELYMDSEQSGRDIQLGLSMVGNPSGDYEELGVEDIVEEYIDDDEDDEADYDDEDIDEDAEDIVDDVEGDDEDTFYFTMDFDRSYDEDDRTTAESLNYALDVADENVHAEFAIDGERSEDGAGKYQVSGELDIEGESYGFEFDADVTNALIEARADADEATSLEDFDPTVLIAGASADALKLYTDESVQKLVGMMRTAFEAEVEADATAVVDDDYEEIPDDEEPVEEEAVEAASEMTFGNPQFGWLPEGYAVDTVNVDEEYQDVNCFIVNEETGDSVYIDIGRSYNDSQINHYVLGEDGEYTPVEGTILNEEINSDYTVYNLDDGTLSISIFPGNDTTTEDIIHILSSLTF